MIEFEQNKKNIAFILRCLFSSVQVHQCNKHFVKKIVPENRDLNSKQKKKNVIHIFSRIVQPYPSHNKRTKVPQISGTRYHRYIQPSFQFVDKSYWFCISLFQHQTVCQNMTRVFTIVAHYICPLLTVPRPIVSYYFPSPTPDLLKGRSENTA